MGTHFTVQVRVRFYCQPVCVRVCMVVIMDFSSLVRDEKFGDGALLRCIRLTCQHPLTLASCQSKSTLCPILKTKQRNTLNFNLSIRCLWRLKVQVGSSEQFLNVLRVSSSAHKLENLQRMMAAIVQIKEVIILDY